MTNEEFSLWLNGFFTLEGSAKTQLSKKQLRVIINHLNFTRAAEGELDARNTWLNDFLSKQLVKADTQETLHETTCVIFQKYRTRKEPGTFF
jgi:hypothetical protein